MHDETARKVRVYGIAVLKRQAARAARRAACGLAALRRRVRLQAGDGVGVGRLDERRVRLRHEKAGASAGNVEIAPCQPSFRTCSFMHVCVPASGHAWIGHGAQAGLYGSMAPPAAQVEAWSCA